MVPAQELYAPCVVGAVSSTPSKLRGRPLGRTGVGPRSVRTAAVRAFRLPVGAPATPPRPAPHNGAPVAIRGVVPCTDYTPGGSLAMRGDN